MRSPTNFEKEIQGFRIFRDDHTFLASSQVSICDHSCGTCASSQGAKRCPPLSQEFLPINRFECSCCVYKYHLILEPAKFN